MLFGPDGVVTTYPLGPVFQTQIFFLNNQTTKRCIFSKLCNWGQSGHSKRNNGWVYEVLLLNQRLC